MKSACLVFAAVCALGLWGFMGCSGSSEAGEGSGAAPGDAGSGSGSEAGKSSGQGGSTNGTAGEPGAAGASSAECAPDDCGPQLGLPNWICEDGTTGGPTGRCLKTGNECGWEIRDCPPAGEGGAGNSGGQGNLAGAPAAGGAGSDPCGGCDTPLQICVFQAGGPGPSHFTCATQNPCGAAGACACIVDQGPCETMLMGAPPSYCTCDNGLD